MVTEQQLKERLNTIITEELHIANEVISIVNKLIKELNSSLKETDVKIDENGYKFKQNRIQLKVLNTSLTLYYRCYYFKDAQQLIKYENNINQSCAYSARVNDRLSLINLTFYMVNGTLDKENKSELFDTMYHEVSHIYQQLKMNKHYGFNSDYNTAFNRIESSIPVEYYVALVIYMFNSDEQIAYINGLYGFLSNEFSKTDSDIDIKRYKQSTVYKLLRQCYEAKEFFANNREETDEELDNYTISYERLLRICDETINSLERKIGRVLIKFFTDLQKQGKLSVTDTNNFYNFFT